MHHGDTTTVPVAGLAGLLAGTCRVAWWALPLGRRLVIQSDAQQAQCRRCAGSSQPGALTNCTRFHQLPPQEAPSSASTDMPSPPPPGRDLTSLSSPSPLPAPLPHPPSPITLSYTFPPWSPRGSENNTLMTRRRKSCRPCRATKAKRKKSKLAPAPFRPGHSALPFSTTPLSPGMKARHVRHPNRPIGRHWLSTVSPSEPAGGGRGHPRLGCPSSLFPSYRAESTSPASRATVRTGD